MMVEKLKTINPYDETEIDMDTNSVGGMVYENTPLIHKLNELVDAVNKLQTKVNKLAPNINFAQPEAKENVQDKFAEQRKWIGKLCRFRDNPACEWKYGILDRIYEDTRFPFWDTDCYEYAECEPVLPTDNAIYKGSDND